MGSGAGGDEFHLGFEEAVLAEDAFVADEELGAAAVGEDPDAGHVADLEEHFEDEGDVVGAGDGDLIVGLADQLVLGVAEEFAECGGDFDEFAAGVDDGDVFGLDAGGVVAGGRGERLILKSAGEERLELGHGEEPPFAATVRLISPDVNAVGRRKTKERSNEVTK